MRIQNPTIVKFIEERNLNPVYYYENLHLETTQDQIRDDLRGKAGIYMVYNQVTGGFYVGSGITNKLNTRFRNHLVHKKTNKILKHAVNKYKLCNFSFIILEIYPKLVTRETNKELILLEDYYLKRLLPDYNILTEAGNSFGYKHTELTKIRLKENGLLKLKTSMLHKGKTISEEQKE